MANTSAIKHTTLYCQKGSSDKVYTLQINEVEGGYHVIYANGRRGTALKPKHKTTAPVTLEEAKKIYDKCVKEKTSAKKGYSESVDGGSTLVTSENANKSSGIELQLLNGITESEAVALCYDSAWVAQEKHDGERRPVFVKSGIVDGLNRYGEYVGLKSDIAEGITPSVDMLVDGEDMNSYVAAFDLLEYDGADLRGLGFLARFDRLMGIVDNQPALRVSPVARTTEEKRGMLQRVKDENREGIVFKKANATFTPDRPVSGGDQLKFKLYDEVSVIVSKVNTKRSVQMSVLDTEGAEVSIGNVTIPANANIPAVGDIIEVRYLYAYPNGGSLFQPTFNKPRPDQRIIECRLSKLKYKRTEAD